MVRSVEALLVVLLFFVVADVSADDDPANVDPFSLDTGNIQIKHFLTFFLRVDNDTNWKLEFSDFNNTAGRLMSVANYNKNTPVEMHGPGGVADRAWNIFPEQPMDLASFMLVAVLLSNNYDVLNEKATGLCNIMHGAFDYLPPDQGDQSLNLEELAASWFTYGQVAPDALPQAFKELDLNGDEKISKDEYIDHCICYFVSRDPQSNCRWLLGPDNLSPKFLN